MVFRFSSTGAAAQAKVAPLLSSNSTSQGSGPSVASPQTLGPVAGGRAEGEVGAEAKLLLRGPVTTAVRSRRTAHFHFKICHTFKKKKTTAVLDFYCYFFFFLKPTTATRVGLAPAIVSVSSFLSINLWCAAERIARVWVCTHWSGFHPLSLWLSYFHFSFITLQKIQIHKLWSWLLC